MSEAEKAAEAGIPRTKLMLLKNPAPSVDTAGPPAGEGTGPFPSPYALFLGRLYPEKGAEILIRAFAQDRRWAEVVPRLAPAGLLRDDQQFIEGLVERMKQPR